MARQIVAHCFNVDGINKSEKAVLLAMADFAGNTGIVYACQEKIGKKIGYSVRTVRNAIKSLVEKGLLQWIKRGITNVYKFANIRDHNDYPEKIKTYEQQYRKSPPTKKISPDENRQKTTIEPAKSAGKQEKTSSFSTLNRESSHSGNDDNRKPDPNHAKQNPAPTPPALEGLSSTPEPVASEKEWPYGIPESETEWRDGVLYLKGTNAKVGLWTPEKEENQRRLYQNLIADMKNKRGSGLIAAMKAAIVPEPEPAPDPEVLLAQARQAFSGAIAPGLAKKKISKAAAKQLQAEGIFDPDVYEVLS